MRRISDFFAWLGGADNDALRNAPSERTRFTQMGGVLLTTAGLAVASMSFALHDGLKLGWTLAWIMGVLWGFVILNLDRLLVLSIGMVRGGARMLLMVLPRFLIAVVLAMVISTPLVLRIFSSSIGVQIYNAQLETSQAQEIARASTTEQHQIDAIKRQIAADKSVLSGTLPVGFTSPQLKAAQTKVTELSEQLTTEQHEADVALEAWQCERKGAGRKCRKATTVVGQGPLADVKEARYQREVRDVDRVKEQLATARGKVSEAEKAIAGTQSDALRKAQAAAAKELPGLQKKLAGFETSLEQDAAEGTTLNQADNGLPAQIEALFEIGERHPSLGFAHWAVFLLFFMIEMLPVTVKVLLGMGPLSSYEAAVIDDEQIRRAETRRMNERESQARIQAAEERWKIDEGKSVRRLRAEEDMRTHEERLDKHANKHVAAEMMKILDLALVAWSAQVTSQLASAVPAQPPPGGNGSGPSGARVTSAIDLPDEDEL